MSAPSAPVIPPRPSKSPSKEVDAAPPPAAVPQIPARPVKKVAERAVSPNPARFAQSPLREGFSRGHASTHTNDYFSSLSVDPIERSPSVDLPSVGQEGMEYGAIEQNATLAAIQQTSVVSDKLKLHAPKPGLSPETAKDRVAAVTGTDSDKAAALGFGKPSSSRDHSSSRQGHRRQPSSTFSVHSDHEHDGIPEIGQRVPIARHLGDVQAPSPDFDPEAVQRHHHRKHSARNLPPGSYGLHGHGEHEGDLHKAYYDKHPELRQKEHVKHHERANDFSMSKNDLNRLVRDTANRPASASSREHIGTPTDDLAFQAADHHAYKMFAPPKATDASAKAESSAAGATSAKEDEDDRIHIDDSNHAEFYGYSGHHADTVGGETKYHAPILAADEMEFGPEARMQHPAIHAQDRTDSFDADAPLSKPIIRPPIVHRPYSQPEFSVTKLDDVKEYDPLFPEESTKAEQAKREAVETKARRNFPSKDIWEDAPSSVHYTVEVSTPDVEEETATERRPSSYFEDRPITPARAFAQYHEELAEREAKGQSQGFLPLQEKAAAAKPSWIDHQSHLVPGKSPSARRFPSKDIWEDAPESHIHETTVSEEQEAEEAAASTEPEVKAKQPPTIPDRPKPQMPARPVKRGSGDASVSEAAAAKPKPPVPARPTGSKIAALQAGFMNDLNKRLQIGPQAPKKDEPKEEEPVEEEKAPLADARKSRARGPQRRAPTTKVAETKPVAPVLALSSPQTLWSINPEDSSFEVTAAKEEEEEEEEKPEPKAAVVPKEIKPEVAAKQTETEAAPKETKAEVVKDAPEEPAAEEPAEAKPAGLEKTTTKEDKLPEVASAEPEEE